MAEDAIYCGAGWTGGYLLDTAPVIGSCWSIKSRTGDLIGKELKQGAHQPVWPKVRRDRSSIVSGAKMGAR
jgi:hypothetical protein